MSQRTERDYKYTAPKDEAPNVPEWAEDIEVGDEVSIKLGPDCAFDAEVVGFSTLFDVSYPVIPAPAEMVGERGGIETCAVERKHLVENQIEIDPDLEGSDGYIDVEGLIDHD